VGLGLVVYDVLYLTLAAALYGGAAAVSLWVRALLGGVSPYVAWPLALLAALFALTFEVAVLSALCPRLVPGRYPMLKGRVFWGWLLRSMLRRVLLLPGLKWVLFNSNVLRFCALRAMGARVAFTASISSDVDLLDPSLVEIGPGAVIGSRCLLTAHYVQEGLLVLDEIRVGAGALLAGDVGLAPGVTIGEHALVKVRTSVNVRATIGPRAEVGPLAVIDALATVGAEAKIGTGAYVPVRGVVPDGGRVEAFSSASSTTSKAAPAV